MNYGGLNSLSRWISVFIPLAHGQRQMPQQWSGIWFFFFLALLLSHRLSWHLIPLRSMWFVDYRNLDKYLWRTLIESGVWKIKVKEKLLGQARLNEVRTRLVLLQKPRQKKKIMCRQQTCDHSTSRMTYKEWGAQESFTGKVLFNLVFYYIHSLHHQGGWFGVRCGI